MTQDPYGQPPGTGSVVHGELVPDDVVPDDEAEVTPPSAPMTQFQKVASALRGDRTDPAMPADIASDAATATSQGTHDEATHPEEVGAARSPDAESRDYWDDADEAGPASETAAPASETAASDRAAAAGADMATQDPTMTQPDLYGAAGRAETPTAEAPSQEGLRPGESDHGPGDFSDLTYRSLLPDAAEFKAQWRQVQFRFVDDPRGSVTEAADVVAQVTAKLEAAIAERQRALRARWSEAKSADTESLRETLLMYRAFLDQLTGPRDG